MAAVFGSPVLRTLVLFGWLAGFTVVPEALAAPYAHALGGGAPTIGLLMAAMPAGTVIGGFVIGRLLRPSDRMRPMGWLAMLSCAPLIFSLAHPPLPVLVLLWALAGAGGAYQLAAAAAFVTALPGRAPGARVRGRPVRAAGRAGPGHPDRRGGRPAGRATGAVALAGLLGLLAAAALATDWTRRHAELISMLMSGRETASPGPAPPPHRPAPRRQPPRRPPLRRPAWPTPTAVCNLPAARPDRRRFPDAAPRPAEPPVLNLPVAERGTGRRAATGARRSRHERPPLSPPGAA